jgi:hypothetical protein
MTILGSLALCAHTAPCGEIDNKKPRTTSEKKPTETVVDARKLFDALENHNRPPVLHGSRPDEFPVFDKAYDWSEQKRVASAIQRIVDHAEELWPELVQHLDDKRYCIAFELAETPCICSVGRVCGFIISDHLSLPYYQHLPQDSELIFHWLHVPQVARRGEKALKAWCIERSKKKLYELQIEVCEWAMQRIPELETVPANDRDYSVKQVRKSAAAIQAQIESLRKSQKAMKAGRLGAGATLYLYGPEEAEAEATPTRSPESLDKDIGDLPQGSGIF